jgi:plastocyanin
MIGALLLVAQLHPNVAFCDEAPPTPAQFRPEAAKIFNVTARSFEFEFSPEPAIEVGDSVTLIIEAADGAHGFFLEHYMQQGVTLLPDQPVTVNFIANTPGTFTYFCTVFCGIGHFGMGGELTVSAPSAPPPAITSFTPASAPVTGGTPIAITGTNFVAGAVVRFGETNALVTIVNSPESITVMTPAHPERFVFITVTNPDGQSASSPSQFAFGSPDRPARRRAVRR